MISPQFIVKSRFESIHQFEHQFENTICDYDFGPRAFVLIWNLSLKTDLGYKAMLCKFMGPMLVLHCTQNSSYCLTELNGTVSDLCFVAFRLIPYHTHLCSLIPVIHLVK
jgi:hypothetical protein